MPIEPTPAIGEARAALAARLREIRVDADVSAIDLARRAGWPRSKVSKIEHARQTPTTEDSFMPLWERTRKFRIYEAGVVPGLFQTPAYARARMRRIIEFNGIPDDLEHAVQARLDRQRVVHARDHTFAAVLEENVLYARIGDTNMMAAQLAHLISVAVLPNVSVGIIPRNIDRTMWASPGFWIYDDERVIVETPLSAAHDHAAARGWRVRPLVRGTVVYGSRRATRPSDHHGRDCSARHLICQQLRETVRAGGFEWTRHSW